MTVELNAQQQKELDEALKGARTEEERAALLAHATTDGPCDAEYCPWAYFSGTRGGESLCIRKQTHNRNCRCPDCCEADLDY